MADFKISNTRPPAGDIKVGSSDVYKIYTGYSEIWPPTQQGEVLINGLIWQTVNTNTLQKSTSGDILIATTPQEAYDYLVNETPAAVHFNFNPTDVRLVYNIWAAKLITPPEGFRLPTRNDWIGLKNASQVDGSIQNITKIGGGVPNFWDPDVHANPSYNELGFNANGISHATPSIGGGTITFDTDSWQSWWNSDALTSLNRDTFLIKENSNQIIWDNSWLGNSEDKYLGIRFCKSASDSYTPVVGSSFRALGSQSTSPFIGLFNSDLQLVSPQPSFGALPSNSYTVGAASDNYTYILAGGKNQTTLSPRISTDYGATWSPLPSPVSGLYRAEDLTMSKSGQVMVLEPGGTNNYIFVSNDFGSSFTQVTLPLPVGFNVTVKKMVAVSSGGQYIIVSTGIVSSTASKGGLFVSQDYGATFTYITDSLPSPVSTSGYDQVAVSGDGKYQYLLHPVANESKYSSDYGVTWVNKNYGSSDFRETSAISNSGEYALFPRNATNGLFTDDFGATANEVLNIGNQRRASISNSGEFAIFIMAEGTTHYTSINYLSSFSSVPMNGFDGVIVDV